jgi:hypothetical protein
MRMSESCLGLAWMIVIALLPREAAAQSPITVTLSPGQTTQTLVAPNSLTFDVLYVASEEYVCNLPTAATINDRILTAARDGRLQATLTSLELLGTASAASIGQTYGRLVGAAIPVNGGAFSSQTVTISQKTLGNTGYTHTFRTNCLTVPEARAGINEMRRIIRAYLGLPAPTN